MKLKSCHTALLTAVFFTLLIPFNVLAQEDRFSLDAEMPTNGPGKQDQETPSGSDNPETRSNKNSTPQVGQEPAVTRDSELKNVKPAVRVGEKAQKEEEKVQKEEEDPLSFNFLYYIIEKFKSSDIVE